MGIRLRANTTELIQEQQKATQTDRQIRGWSRSLVIIADIQSHTAGPLTSALSLAHSGAVRVGQNGLLPLFVTAGRSHREWLVIHGQPRGGLCRAGLTELTAGARRHELGKRSCGERGSACCLVNSTNCGQNVEKRRTIESSLSHSANQPGMKFIHKQNMPQKGGL